LDWQYSTRCAVQALSLGGGGFPAVSQIGVLPVGSDTDVSRAVFCALVLVLVLVLVPLVLVALALAA
jgi:hypothetical protein